MVSANQVTVNSPVKKHMNPSKQGKLKLLLLSLFLVTNFVLAAPRPVIPPMGEDLKLTKGIPVDQFFAARLQNTRCQTELKTAQQQYLAAKNKLKSLVSQNQNASTIDKAEKEMDDTRKVLLAKTQICGPCATQDLEKRVVTTQKKEYWYLTDGSCRIGLNEDATSLNRYFENALSRLKNIKKYPGKQGGFKALLEFNEIDMETGELLPQVEKVEHNPFFAFIGVRGPVALGIPVGFWYIFRNDLIEKEDKDLKEFAIHFESVKKPANFPTPDLKIQSASGKLHSTMQRELSLVQGMWYVNNRGYFRYYTAADFGINIPFASDFALSTLLDTLLTVTEDSVSGE
jgi:hypothetical protein